MAPSNGTYIRRIDNPTTPLRPMYRVNVRRALLMSALMLLLPTTQANVSDWRGPDAVKPTQDGSEFTAFRVPTNATVLDSWVEISNDENAQSRDDLLSWSVDQGLDQGIRSGTCLLYTSPSPRD